MIGATTGATPDAEAVKEYKIMTQGGSTPAEAIQKRFDIMTKELERLERIAELEAVKREGFQNIEVNEMAAITSLELFQRAGMNDDVVEMAKDTAKTQEELRKILASIRNMNAGGSSLGQGWHTQQTGLLQAAINKSKRQNASAWAKALGKQHGGMINEPIWGIGESGQRYKFGEAGPEMITPMTGGKSTGNMVANINVNIEKVLQDVDLEQIKPIVERALLEVHSRRGII